jgi:hypothetical protein
MIRVGRGRRPKSVACCLKWDMKGRQVGAESREVRIFQRRFAKLVLLVWSNLF